MKKTKKALSELPKNIQSTFITTAGIAFVLNAIYWICLLIRVYPNGIRLSQFSVMAIGQILLPAALFAISFLAYKKSVTRFDHIFNSTILTLIGVGSYHIVAIIERLLSQYHNISSNLVSTTWAPAISMTIGLCLFVGIVSVLRLGSKTASHSRRLHIAALLVITAAFIADAVFSLGGLISQLVGDNITINLLAHPLLITPVILPLAFFATAYFILQTVGGRLNRLFTAVIYTLVGVMVVWITSMVFQIGVWALPDSDSASLHALGLQTIFATVAGLSVYTFLIVTHSQSKKASKKSK